ncbi:MAG: hypothetical protein ACP5OR_02270 [Candidatus Dormibacteria bacterium]
MLQVVHLGLALCCVVLVSSAIVEACFRLVRRGAPSHISLWIEVAFEILVALAGIAGIVLFVTHHRPQEMLHVLYGLIAFGAIPVGDVIASEYSDGKKAALRLATGCVALGVIVRLFMTG